jgi:NAD(P)-dependent dehydrogenase (short-subunit alcohol dehydrogenase family)
MATALPAQFSLSSKTAIVTSSTGSLGLAISIILAEVGRYCIYLASLGLVYKAPGKYCK